MNETFPPNESSLAEKSRFHVFKYWLDARSSTNLSIGFQQAVEGENSEA